MPTNNFLPFCPTDTGTNLLSESDYTAATDRTSGNKPGVASSKLNNKAMRQANFITSQVAQYISDKTGTDLLDDADTAKLLSQINAAIVPLAPSIQKFTTGSGNYNATFVFFIVSGSATAAATYTNNGVTYTVVSTVASGLQVSMTGNGAPAVSGTLTKASGTGDATLSFRAVRAPLYLKVKMVGGGGGGGGSNDSGSGTASDGSDGASTSFGTSLLTATGGGGGKRSSNTGGSGGTATVNSPAVGVGSVGGRGQGGFYHGEADVNYSMGGSGGASPFGGAGNGGGAQDNGYAAAVNTGSGGGGGGIGTTGVYGGAGAGAGAYVEAYIPNSAATYAYVVGAGGAGAPSGGGAISSGGNGGSGLILVEEHYQ